MTPFDPQTLDEFKDFINKNTFVAAVTTFGGDNTSETLLSHLTMTLTSFPNVKCAKIEMENMHDFANEYHIGMPTILYFNSGRKVHQNDSAKISAIEFDLQKYCGN
jgi:hypothetical protein